MASKAVAKHRSRSKPFTLPVAIVAGFIPPIAGTYAAYKSNYGSWYMTGAYLGKVMTGFDITKNNHWDIGSLMYGLVPVMSGVGVHMLANKLGINRALSRSGIPFIRI
jgi:hypothetical protein